MDNSQRLERMQQLIQDALQPTQLEIIDDSHKHIGHAGAKEGKGHFTVVIQSEALEGKRMLQQHRAIYDALGDMMETDIHALAIKVIK
ncbi:BolA family transcriptional regulator [Kangiella profundi]|uniref:BolA family transcriptional regulator n=1 Tax=Kangiella profundi TaxID=1561924 RepID=A0A2K9A6U9_9GAMM|nr:BolA family protein [Kangiella profundi]AUD78460.1 BolA family transcriptional regulator [Kangiella profundi]GGF08108.1 cell division protein BolA [Kangiella profundi]